MSTPRMKKGLNNVMFQLSGVASSLHMDCEEIPKEEQNQEQNQEQDQDVIYLVNRFVFARHAYEHLNAAIHSFPYQHDVSTLIEGELQNLVDDIKQLPFENLDRYIKRMATRIYTIFLDPDFYRYNGPDDDLDDLFLKDVDDLFEVEDEVEDEDEDEEENEEENENEGRKCKN